MCAPVKICHLTLSANFSSREADNKQASRILYFAMNNKLYWAEAEPLIDYDVANWCSSNDIRQAGIPNCIKKWKKKKQKARNVQQ